MVLNEALKDGGIPEGYAEVDVEFYRFENPGDKLQGILINKTQTTIKGGNRIGKYTIKKQDGKKVAFLGSVQLDEKMSNIGLGQDVWVQFTHKESLGDTGNEMKCFKVFVKTAQ